MQSGEAADPEFSTAILKRLHIHKAKAKLREIHSDLLQQHLDRTQLIGDDVNVAKEMGWGDEEVCAGSIYRMCMQKVCIMAVTYVKTVLLFALSLLKMTCIRPKRWAR